MGQHAPVVSYDRMLEHLYASVLEPERFEHFAADLRLALHAHLVALQCDAEGHRHDVRKHFSTRTFDVPVPDYRNDSSVNLYFVRGVALFRERGVIDGSDLFAKGELERTAFYADILVPLGVHYSMGFCLDMDASGRVVCLSVSRDRHRPHFAAQDMQLAHRLLPHLRNVYSLQQRFQQLESTLSAMDRVSYGIWLLGEGGGVIRANTAAQKLLAAPSGGLYQQGASLRAAWRPDQPAFSQAIANAVSRLAAYRSDFLLRDRNGQAWAACTLHPLCAVAFDSWLPFAQAACILLVHPLTQATHTPTADLRDIFGLTAAEARLAAAMLQYGTLPECISHLGKSYETLRTQLKSLFLKTEAHSQAELLHRLEAANN